MCLQMASQPEKRDAQAASAWEEAAPLERSQKRSSRSTPSASPRNMQPHSPRAAADPKSRHSSSRRSRHVDITDEAQLQDPSLDANAALDQRLPLMANLSGNYSLESSGTERYDLYIDRAAAYDKAQQNARHTAHLAVSPFRFFPAVEGFCAAVQIYIFKHVWALASCHILKR